MIDENYATIPITVAGVTPFSFAASFNTDAITLRDLQMGSANIVMVGGATATGSLEIQLSDDTAAPTNWTTWTGTAVAINGTTGSPFFWDLNFFGGHWFRMSFTRVAGTGSGAGNLIRKAWP